MQAAAASTITKELVFDHWVRAAAAWLESTAECCSYGVVRGEFNGRAISTHYSIHFTLWHRLRNVLVEYDPLLAGNMYI